MVKHKIISSLVFLLLIKFCLTNQDSINSALVNANVERLIDLSSHIAKITNTISLENAGSVTVKSFLVTVDVGIAGHLSYIGAKVKDDDNEQKLRVISTKISDHRGKAFWRVELEQNLQPGKKTTIEVNLAFTHILQPHPSYITQSEKQLVLFRSNHYFYSPYPTKAQTTTVQLASNNIESYSKLKPVSQSDNSITYGPYENIPAFSEDELLVHYENNSPFLTVTSMTRTIEVSHWGNIAVEETYDMKHSGAILKGSFSRYEYQRDQNGISSIKSFKTVLPAAASDVYYRDEIGNISTSHLRELDDSVEVELRPRFPLFGGWKTHYTLGYNVPSYEYLYNSGDDYILKMRFIDHVFDDHVIDHITVKVILPEGAKNIKLKSPYEINRQPDEVHFTYLDTFGRPVIIAHKSNLVEFHIQDFELHYTFQKLLMLQEPLLLVGAFYLLFLVVIIYVRLDFSITKDSLSESKLRLAGFIEQIQNMQDKRNSIYKNYDEAINKFKTSKDNGAFVAVLKKINTDYKEATNSIADILTKLKTDNPDGSEKVVDLQKLDKQLKEQINSKISFVEKLIAGKMSKQQYIESEQGINVKKSEILLKIQNLLNVL